MSWRERRNTRRGGPAADGDDPLAVASRCTSSSRSWPSLWLFPLVWVFYTALRPYADTQRDGYVSLRDEPELRQLRRRLHQGDFPKFYLNSLIVTVPAVIADPRRVVVSWPSPSRASAGGSTCSLLMMFTAGNLLPQQVIIVPLYRMYLLLPLPAPLSDNGLMYDQYVGIILIHIVFQVGFCIFVLSNYMKTLSQELTEAAVVDGASVCGSGARSSCPCAGPRWRRWRCSSSPSSTTTSSGPCC